METPILLLILSGLLIAVLVGASIWSARREKSRVFSNTFSTRPPATPINNELHSEVPPTLSPQGFNSQSQPQNPSAETAFAPVDQQEIENSLKNIQIRLPDQPEEQFAPAPQPYSAQPIAPEPVAPQQAVTSEQNFTNPNISVQLEQPQPEPEQPAEAEENSQEPQLVTLYVVAAEGQQFHGTMVQQQLEALGFIFGEHQIFHRHLDNASSPVLFSVANMLQPGIFDLNKMEQFATVGLVFFMHLPSVGNDLVNARLMIKTVESFAQAVGGFVLDEQHQLFDDAARQAYLLRVSQQ